MYGKFEGSFGRCPGVSRTQMSRNADGLFIRQKFPQGIGHLVKPEVNLRGLGGFHFHVYVVLKNASRRRNIYGRAFQIVQHVDTALVPGIVAGKVIQHLPPPQNKRGLV